MEEEGLRVSLNYLSEQGVSIIIIASDRHGALMKSNYADISHQNDVWHMTKGIC